MLRKAVYGAASAVGAAKLAVTAVGAYARIRKQFKVHPPTFTVEPRHCTH
jgi:alkylation response protein AidB-like acyl-CoA dehydrogenase